MEGITIIQFLFDQVWPELDLVLNSYKTQGSVGEIFDVMELNELTNLALNKCPCIIVVSISSTRDLSQIVSFIKNNRNVIKSNSHKVVVLNRAGNKDFDLALSKIGLSDILDYSLKDKALKFKFDFWMRSLSLNHESNSEKEEIEEEIKWLSASDCSDDFWIIKNKDDVKYVRQKWTIKMIGPNPHLGDWNPTDKKNQWRFDVKESFEKSQKLVGHWVFEGEQKPEYLWKDERWLFSSSSLSLFYFGQRSSCRFNGIKNKLSISYNSPQALALELFLYSSINRGKKNKQELNEEMDQIDEKLLSAPKISIFFKANDPRFNIHYISKLDDIFEDQLILKAQKKVYETQQNYTINIKLEQENQKEEYVLQGFLEEVFSEGIESYLSFKMDLKELKKITFLMDTLSSRQDSINEFLLKAKGY